MKKIPLWLVLLLPVTALLSGCRTVRTQGPEVKVPPTKPRLMQAKHSLKQKTSVTKMPQVLGGLVQSDSWVIYKDKEQEEFKGHVSYDNGIYTFRADYALSERAQNRFTARGNVYLKQAQPQAPVYEAYAHEARYNYKTQKGVLQAGGKDGVVRLIYTAPKEPSVTATARRVSFDLASEVFILQGNVRLERPTPQGVQTLTAEKATLKQREDWLMLEGGATASDSLRTLEAETLVYDGKSNASYAYGARPLLHGKSEQGTFAIIADKVQADNEGRLVTLDGKVQGWLVSPRINESEVNKKF